VPVVGGDDKARTVDIVANSDSVCAVARRYGLSPQQLFGWRRRLREAAAGYSETEELRFAPAVVDAGAPAPAVGRQGKRTERRRTPFQGPPLSVYRDSVIPRIAPPIVFYQLFEPPSELMDTSWLFEPTTGGQQSGAGSRSFNSTDWDPTILHLPRR
jgi:transposase-like protein